MEIRLKGSKIFCYILCQNKKNHQIWPDLANFSLFMRKKTSFKNIDYFKTSRWHFDVSKLVDVDVDVDTSHTLTKISPVHTVWAVKNRCATLIKDMESDAFTLITWLYFCMKVKIEPSSQKDQKHDQ